MNLEAYRKYRPALDQVDGDAADGGDDAQTGIRCGFNTKLSSREPVHDRGGEVAADKAREERKPVAEDNPFLAFQEQISKQIVSALDQWRDSQEALSEAMFLAVYGSPALQAAVGVDPQSAPSRRREMDLRSTAKCCRRASPS